MLSSPLRLIALLIVFFALLTVDAARAAPAKMHAKKADGITVTHQSWQGWPDALRLSNGVVEAIIVPEIGRIMAFQFVGHPETNPIFINKDWKGKTVADTDPTTWAAFGGDKLWPSPQSEWPKHNVRGWPPDQTFDGDPEVAQILPNGVRLVTPDSVAFAAHATRTITLKPAQARLYIVQTLIKDKDAGSPTASTDRPRDGFPIGIWSITQTRGDETVFLPLAKSSRFPKGYGGLDTPPAPYPAPYFTTQAGLLRVVRDPKNAHKVGTDAPQGWMSSLYAGTVLFSEHDAYQPGANYPDGGTPTEVYMNPNPAYMEMELLGPLVPLTHGNQITHNIYWQLQRLPRVPRSRAEAQARVKAAMGKP